jgi:glutaredoxin
MEKRNIGIVLLITALVVVGVIIWGVRQPENSQLAATLSQDGNEQSGIVFYFGEECSHCKVVEKFIEDNQIEQKVVFAKKEVWHNAENSAEMQLKAKECGLDLDKIGVPFLSARGKCYIGEVEVENFFKQEAGLQ